MADDPEQLRGGINEVVRLGTTVRRPVGPWSPTVHELPTHLADAVLGYLERVGLGIARGA